MNMLFTYAKMLSKTVRRVTGKVLRKAASRFSAATRYLLGFPPVELPNGTQQLLSPERANSTMPKKFAKDRVSASGEFKWEAGGQDLLDETDKRSLNDSGSSTEDELIELSDGEERSALISSLSTSRYSRLLSTSAK
uniref:Uncharacterized protein n=1 Tax=Peronospora matthiolae TaxID=2874970 RepID=A0AAV1T5M0_9STRA